MILAMPLFAVLHINITVGTTLPLYRLLYLPAACHGSVTGGRQKTDLPPPDSDERFVCWDKGRQNDPNDAGHARCLHTGYVIDGHLSLSLALSVVRLSARSEVAVIILGEAVTPLLME